VIPFAKLSDLLDSVMKIDFPVVISAVLITTTISGVVAWWLIP